MIEVQADTLEEAYKKVSSTLSSSIVDLDIDIVQNPTTGIFGFFKKPAIIRAYKKGERKKESMAEKKVLNTNSSKNEKVENEIREGIKSLLNASCFDIDLVDLIVDNENVYIKLDGKDVALVIGKEGYRYKALSYLFHNWIKVKYGLNTSLEISEFLKNQEEMIDNYILSIKDRIEQNPKAQTKPLDGILVKIALSKLREAYPDKYVAVRNLRDGRKIVIINDFRRND